MLKPAKHKKEKERLEALRNFEILDSDPEQEYDDLTLLASFITKSPVAMISFVDANRQWFKSKIGLDFNETPRDEAFCAHAILETDIFEVEDASKDERFYDNPFVTERNLKFYAGAQLITDEGLPIGTLCVMDNKPRKLSLDERKALNALGRQILAHLKLRLKNEEVSKELQIAKTIQKSMLPDIFKPNSSNPKIKISASMNCAKEVGGDFYDYFYTDDEHLVVVLGDVSGKGVPAALYMAMTRILIQAAAQNAGPSADCISKVNNLLTKESVPNMFVTLFYAVLNINTGELEFINCGHNQPIIIRNDGEVFFMNQESQLILGVMERYTFSSQKLKLNEGDSIIIYTDGVTEAFDKNGNEFSDTRLLSIVKKNKKKSIQGINEKLIYEVYKFSEGVIQSDDITMLLLKYER